MSYCINLLHLFFVDIPESMNEFLGIFPLIVITLGQQVLVDIPLENYAYFGNFTF